METDITEICVFYKNKFIDSCSQKTDVIDYMKKFTRFDAEVDLLSVLFDGALIKSYKIKSYKNTILNRTFQYKNTQHGPNIIFNH